MSEFPFPQQFNMREAAWLEALRASFTSDETIIQYLHDGWLTFAGRSALEVRHYMHRNPRRRADAA
jgi:hypothetical protein